jgi:phosphoribosylformylglycinamidine (FGAM) synthase PurS component
MTVVCVEVRLTIPDNEARTAFTTLARLGVAVAALERADVYRCEVDDAAAAGLANELRACEGVFNPNKHALSQRAGDGPRAGEVWVSEAGRPDSPAEAIVVSGRTLAGVRSLERATAWRLFASDGTPAPPQVVTAATDALLCNPAFQRARYEEPPLR